MVRDRSLVRAYPYLETSYEPAQAAGSPSKSATRLSSTRPGSRQKLHPTGGDCLVGSPVISHCPLNQTPSQPAPSAATLNWLDLLGLLWHMPSSRYSLGVRNAYLAVFTPRNVYPDENMISFEMFYSVNGRGEGYLARRERKVSVVGGAWRQLLCTC